MKPATRARLALVVLLPVLAGCGREPQRVPARDNWRVADVEAQGSIRTDIFEIQQHSITPLPGGLGTSPAGAVRPRLSIEPCDGPVRGSVRIQAAMHTRAVVGPPFPLMVSFDGARAEPVMFQRSSVDITAPREFASRMQRHRLMSIRLPGGDRHHPPGVVTYRLDGLGPQLAAIDAELHARREAAGPMSNAINSLVTLLGG